MANRESKISMPILQSSQEERAAKKISTSMTQIEFQREVGRLEVLGELIIREERGKR